MKKTTFYTLGCRANQAQTEVLRSSLPEEGDICVINTCTVTHDSERKSRQAIRKAIRENPKAKIIVTGCYAKLETDKLKKTFPKIEIITPPSLAPSSVEGPVPRIRMNLMIQDGCEHFCSYCIVPYARGKIKSKPLDQVAAEADQLIQAGAREIILTGINLGTYQYDLSKVINLLSSIENLFRIRLSSLEPMYIDRKLIDVIAKDPKVCKYLNIPLQSGDNSILKTMGRNYTSDDYLSLIDYARNKMPDCGITTDIIVGFPGEGEKEFQNTVNLVNRIKFSRIHIFSYSKRKETPAAEMPNQVDDKTKKARNKTLHDLRNKHMQEFADQYLNKEVEILVEQQGEGLTSNFIRCFFDSPSNSTGLLKTITAKLITNSGEIRG
jgi:threonylcarbamoyladenosine tRNA methylthiotransferase MtaB